MTRLEELLENTSRTFALSIPVLPEPTRRQVLIAYLLFRIADTFEDATLWPPEKRIRALGEFAEMLRDPSQERAGALAAEWLAPPPCDHAGYLELLRETPGVIAHFLSLPEDIAAAIRASVTASAEGMARFVGRMSGEGDLRLAGIDDLRDYCHVVAGLVGEMLTEIFLFERPALAPAAGFLRERASRFGEGLQLVNILKDAGGDAREGRCYLPAGVPRAEVLALARTDLEAAREYVRALHEVSAPRGLIAFTALPVLLAADSLDLVAREGPGVKVSRQRVGALVAQLDSVLDRGASPF